MVFFCNQDYPLNIICNISWKVAVIFVVIFIIWMLIKPKKKIN